MSKTVFHIIALSLLFSCNNSRQPTPEKILADFDSVSRSLEESNAGWETTTSLYDSINKKYGESFIRQFNYTMGDCIAYLSDLKNRFAVSCGGTYGEGIPGQKLDDLDLTEKFFFKGGHVRFLFMKLKEAENALISRSDDPALDEEIGKITAPFNEGEAIAFGKKYFNRVPPVAAFTILSKFQNDLTRLEQLVLKNILSTVPATR